MKSAGDPHVDIIDPVHGFIRVFDRELSIVDHPIFQRLRRIRQLSGAHFTYPSAQHTRFEHSLGVMHIAGQAGHALIDKGIMNGDELAILRMAALLHDIGHGPFSHLFEEIMLKYHNTSHEELGKKIILKSEIGDLLEKNSFDRRLVAAVAFGTSKKYPYMNQIVSGPLSADMMDYLGRDSHFTGAVLGRTAHQRITQSFDVHKRQLALERSALHSFESMMHSRYQMFRAVYFHRTVRAAEMMLLEALKLSDETFRFTSLDLDNVVNLTDEHVLSVIATSDKPDLERARSMAVDYQNRRLLKCVFERILTGKKDMRGVQTEEIHRKLTSESGVPAEEIFVDSSVTPSIPLAPSTSESGNILVVSRERHKPVVEELLISEIPSVSAISGFMNILRVYTKAEYSKKVEIATESLGDI